MVAVDRLLKRALSTTVRQRSLFSVMMGKHFLITACEKAREVKFLGISDAEGRKINDLLFNKTCDHIFHRGKGNEKGRK